MHTICSAFYTELIRRQPDETQAEQLRRFYVILYLALACTLLGYLLQNKALEGISSRTVALLQCTAPVLTAFFSFFLLGETLSLMGLIGAAIILACVVAETLVDTREEKM